MLNMVLFFGRMISNCYYCSFDYSMKVLRTYFMADLFIADSWPVSSSFFNISKDFKNNKESI